MNIKYTGFAIAIAWPETFCKQPGSWYDSISKILGISKNHYYKVGHAALVLIDSKKMSCHYFDFGRYHTPFQYARVRSESTDVGLKINEIPEIPEISSNAENIENFLDILKELQSNYECHGEGKLYASYCQINFQKAFAKATEMQNESLIPYGPFKYKGSNCSRFVNSVIVAGKPNWKILCKLKYFVSLTPTPRDNVNSLSNKIILPKILQNKPFYPLKISNKKILKSTLPEPVRHINISENAQWISGEGAGSWFSISLEKEHYKICRRNNFGALECEGKFEKIGKSIFNTDSAFKFIYLSHCKKVKIQQNNTIIEFVRIG
jgi:hypothetical protein